MKISDTFKSIYTQEWEIYISQCSTNSKLRYTELSNLFQLTAAKHSDLGGMSFFDMQKQHQAWVSSRMRFEIFDLPKWHEEVTITTWIESLDGVRSIRNLEMWQGSTKLAGASTLWVVLNTQKRRPEPIALSHDHLTKYPEKKATSIDYQKIDLNIPTQIVGKHQVKYSDLDVVNHVNHVKYLEWCLDFVDRSILDQNKIKAFEMNFIKELNDQDTVDIETAIWQNEQVFYIKNNNQVCFALHLYYSSEQ